MLWGIFKDIMNWNFYVRLWIIMELIKIKNLWLLLNLYKGGWIVYLVYKKECCGCRKIGYFNLVCCSIGK